jgi:hypothetical protein
MGSNVTISSTAAAGRSPIGRTVSNLLAAMFLLSGLVCSCAKDLAAVEDTPSEAFDRHLETSLGRLFEEAAVKHPGQSGFTIIRHGRPAFTAHVAFADPAQQSLDLQYSIWEGDATGWILMDRLMRAADRGVRVRVLIDDISLAGRDARVAAMGSMPAISVTVDQETAAWASRTPMEPATIMPIAANIEAIATGTSPETISDTIPARIAIERYERVESCVT